MNTPTNSEALPLTNCSASWVKRNDEMPERGERVIAFSPVYPKGHEMRFRILDGQFIRITTEVEYWAYCEPMADSLPSKQLEGRISVADSVIDKAKEVLP
jgi:hypothetical protein